MDRSANIEIFRDTLNACRTHPRLKEAIAASVAAQQIILQGQEICGALPNRSRSAICVTKKRSFEAALGHVGKRVCVLNFASAINPGGGVQAGSSAQEESLCRCSTLYPCLDSPDAWRDFYLPHRREIAPLHSDDLIYTPGVVIFREDADPMNILPETHWQKVNIITCAAPNLRAALEHGFPVPDEAGLARLFEKRMRRILEIAARRENEAVILGAFGCGAFGNDPGIVAPALNRAVQAFRHCFDTIEFAVFCRGANDINHRAFARSIQS